MKLKEALVYVRDNYENLTEFTVLGVAYTPNDDVDFQIVEISLDQDAKKDDGLDYYCISVEGGNIPSEHEGTEDFYGGSNLDELLSELPSFLEETTYHVHQFEETPMGGLTIEYALKILFPHLPDPDDIWSDEEILDFKNKAIQFIQQIG